MADYVVNTPADFQNAGTSTVKYTDTVSSVSWQLATDPSNGLVIGSTAVPDVLHLYPTGPQANNFGLRQASNAITIQADPATATSYTFNLPAVAPTTAGQVVTFNGSTNVFSQLQAQNQLVVRQNPGPGEFSSLVAAIASLPVFPAAGSPSDTNRFIIHVYAGDYAETAIVLPSYVFAVGEDMRGVRFTQSGTGYSLFTISINSGIAFMSIFNCESGFPCVYFHNSGDYTLFHKIDVTGCEQVVSVLTDSAATDTSLLYLEYFSTTDALQYSLQIVDTNTLGGFGSQVSIENFFTYGHNANGIIINGPNSSMLSQATVLQGDGTGTALTVQNGGELDARGIWVQGWAVGVSVPSDAGTPTLLCSGLLFDQCTLNFDVLNPTATGHSDGYTEYTKTVINPITIPFFISGVDPRVITVAKKGGDFSSVAVAMAAITGNSVATPFVIKVNPGVYVEPPIVGKNFVTVQGYGAASTIIQCSSPTGIAFTGVEASAIRDITLGGTTGVGGIALYISGTTNVAGITGLACYAINLGIGNTETGIKIYGGTYPTYAATSNIVFSDITNATYGIVVANNGSQTTSYFGSSIFMQDLVAPFTTTYFDISGPGVSVDIATASVLTNNNSYTSGSTGFKIYNGANAILFSCAISGVKNGVWNPASAAGPNLNLNSMTYTNCFFDLRVEDANTTGQSVGAVILEKMFVNKSSTFALAGIDPFVVPVSQTGTNISSLTGAISYINPTISIGINSNTTITSAGLFNIQMNGALVTDLSMTPNIPPNTTATFVDDQTMTLSNAATATSTITAQFTVASSSQKYLIEMGPGIYVEPNPVVVYPYISVAGISNVYIVATNPSVPILDVGTTLLLGR